MKAFLILMVCIAFLTSILTAGRETEWGYKDDGEKKLENSFIQLFFQAERHYAFSFFNLCLSYMPDN